MFEPDAFGVGSKAPCACLCLSGRQRFGEAGRSIRKGHADRQINRGRADWRIYGLLADGRHFEVVYDHPHDNDRAAVRIVSVWPC